MSICFKRGVGGEKQPYLLIANAPFLFLKRKHFVVFDNVFVQRKSALFVSEFELCGLHHLYLHASSSELLEIEGSFKHGKHRNTEREAGQKTINSTFPAEGRILHPLCGSKQTSGHRMSQAMNRNEQGATHHVKPMLPIPACKWPEWKHAHTVYGMASDMRNDMEKRRDRHREWHAWQAQLIQAFLEQESSK